MNLSLVDVVENLTPKSSVTVTGGYAFVHFLGNNPGTGNSFIGDSQVSGEVGYDRLLGPHDQGAIVYGYQGFNFSTGVSFHSNVIQLMWGHRISGRMDFLIGAGPQFMQLYNLPTPVNIPTSADTVPPCQYGGTLTSPVLECPTNSLRVSAAGRASLRYRFPKVSLDSDLRSLPHQWIRFLCRRGERHRAPERDTAVGPDLVRFFRYRVLAQQPCIAVHLPARREWSQLFGSQRERIPIQFCGPGSAPEFRAQFQGFCQLPIQRPGF